MASLREMQFIFIYILQFSVLVIHTNKIGNINKRVSSMPRSGRNAYPNIIVIPVGDEVQDYEF